MGQDVTIPGVTEEELLRAAAIDRAKQESGINCVLSLGEMTVRDFIASVLEDEGWEPSDSTARRHLNKLVKAGKMEKAERYDPRMDKSVMAYWFVEGDDGGSLDG